MNKLITVKVNEYIKVIVLIIIHTYKHTQLEYKPQFRVHNNVVHALIQLLLCLEHEHCIVYLELHIYVTSRF